MKVGLQVLLNLAFLILVTRAQDYCLPKLCYGRDPSPHINCNNDGKLGPACPPNTQIVDDSTNKNLIVTKMNNLRNKIAEGLLSVFGPAVRMRSVRWSSDLVTMASKSVKRCKAVQDTCRNTYTFPNVGQLIYRESSGLADIDYRQHIIRMVNKWYGQRSNATAAGIARFTNTGPDYKAFALLVNEFLTHVGCASCSFSKHSRLEVITICNFSVDNIEGAPVYRTGTAASECVAAPTPTHKHLCGAGEPSEAIQQENSWPGSISGPVLSQGNSPIAGSFPGPAPVSGTPPGLVIGSSSGPSVGAPSSPSVSSPSGPSLGSPSGPSSASSSGPPSASPSVPSFGSPSGPSPASSPGSPSASPSGPSFGSPSGPSPPSSSGPPSASPSGPSFGSHSSPSYSNPQGPSYGSPSGPSYGSPSGPSYGSPSGSSYGSPSGPNFASPSAPSYGSPSSPNFASPSAPSYGSPSGPNFAPNSGPSFGSPSGPAMGPAPGSVFEYTYKAENTTAGKGTN